MATVSQQLKGTFTNARKQIEGFEKKAAKQVALLEKKAKASFGEVKEQIDEVPTQLRGAWAEVVERVRGALDFASHDDLRKLTAKVDDLAKKVDKLVRGDKIKAASTKSKPA
jgi:tetrahydromethanopterin S-methyltransferase subunit G